MAQKPDPIVTATRYIARHHPAARAAFVGGSVMRGEGTATSDLDIVVITTSPPAPFRETSVFEDWIIEAFVHSVETLRIWADKDAADRRPVLAQLVTEGAIVADDGVAAGVRSEMRRLLDGGPVPLPIDELDDLRYGITDLMDDLVDSPTGLERLSAIANLVDQVIRLELETTGRWSGRGKWIVRRLRTIDRPLVDALEAAAIEAHHDPRPLIDLAERRLDRHGGRLSAGYRRDGQAIMERWLRSRPGD